MRVDGCELVNTEPSSKPANRANLGQKAGGLELGGGNGGCWFVTTGAAALDGD
jgi:hypothetical protein